MEKRSVTRYRVRRRGHTSPDDERLEEPVHCPEKLFCSSSTPLPPAGLRPGAHGLPPACSPPLTPPPCSRTAACAGRRSAGSGGGAAGRQGAGGCWAGGPWSRGPGPPRVPVGRLLARGGLRATPRRLRAACPGRVGSEGSSFPRMKSPAGSTAAIPVSHDALFGAGSRAVRPYLSCPN